MNTLHENINSVLGLHASAQNLTFVQISLRGVIVFITALIMVRLGDKRFLSNKTAFDAILGFILASSLARAVNGTASFFPTLGGGFVLVGLHRLLAFFSRDSHWFGILVKGKPDQIIREGVVLDNALRRNCLSSHDLTEDLRFNGNVQDPKKVSAAYFERNGQISVVK
jgi:uncharacterized membrane protein YcaP (DUF421 family)